MCCGHGNDCGAVIAIPYLNPLRLVSDCKHYEIHCTDSCTVSLPMLTTQLEGSLQFYLHCDSVIIAGSGLCMTRTGSDQKAAVEIEIFAGLLNSFLL